MGSRRQKRTRQQRPSRNHQAVTKPPEKFVNIPDPLNIRIKANPDGEERYREERDSRRAQLRTAQRLNWISGIGVAGAVVYAVITYFQWRDLRHNFEIDERAWIKVAFKLRS